MFRLEKVVVDSECTIVPKPFRLINKQTVTMDVPVVFVDHITFAELTGSSSVLISKDALVGIGTTSSRPVQSTEFWILELLRLIHTESYQYHNTDSVVMFIMVLGGIRFYCFNGWRGNYLSEGIVHNNLVKEET